LKTLTEREEKLVREKMIKELSKEIFVQSRGQIKKDQRQALAEKQVAQLDLYNRNQMRKSMGSWAQIIVDSYNARRKEAVNTCYGMLPKLMAKKH